MRNRPVVEVLADVLTGRTFVEKVYLQEIWIKDGPVVDDQRVVIHHEGAGQTVRVGPYRHQNQ
jgi:hypothetical protein